MLPTKCFNRLIARTKGGQSTRLHAICDSQGRPLNLFVTAEQVSDNIGARALPSSLPRVEWLLGDRGYHEGERHRLSEPKPANWSKDALEDKGIRTRTPDRKQRKPRVECD